MIPMCRTKMCQWVAEKLVLLEKPLSSQHKINLIFRSRMILIILRMSPLTIAIVMDCSQRKWKLILMCCTLDELLLLLKGSSSNCFCRDFRVPSLTVSFNFRVSASEAPTSARLDNISDLAGILSAAGDEDDANEYRRERQKQMLDRQMVLK